MRFVATGVLVLAVLAPQPGDLRTGVSTWVDRHKKEIVAELLELLAIPNVAADRPNIRRNADHLQTLLARHGFKAEILETAGNPLVYGAMDPVPGARTVLFYCHYDGQPVDPAKWNQPDPFTPVVRGEGADARIYARSASDDKAPIVALMAAVDAVAPLTPEERTMLDAVPDDSAKMLQTFGVAAPERAFPKLQDAMQVPTLNIRGLASSFVGPGARTIIPDRATAAIDIRLVKETSGEDLVTKLRAHIVKQGYQLVNADPDDATRARYGKLARVAPNGPMLEAFRTPTSNPHARALVASMTRTFGQPPVQLRTLGGTVPIAPFIDALGFPALLVPTVNFDNNQHEENENLRLGAFYDSIVTIAAVLRM